MENKNFEALCERLGIKAERREVVKNNNTVMVGYMLGDKNIRPTIYEDTIAEHDEVEIIKIITNITDGLDDTDFIFTKENAKLMLMFGVRNKEMNKVDNNVVTFDIPEFKELEGYFYLKLTESDCIKLGIINRDEDGCAAVTIHKGLMDILDMSIEEMKEYAEINTFNEMTLQPMSEVIREILLDRGADPIPWNNDEIETLDDTLWCASVLNKTRGAGVLASKKCMDRIKEFGRNKKAKTIAILPSSIHEVLITKLESIEQKNEFDSMVKEVNETQVRYIDRLADNAFVIETEDK